MEMNYGLTLILFFAGPNDHTIAQIKDAVRDGLRSVKNTLEDEAVVLVSLILLIILFYSTYNLFPRIHSIYLNYCDHDLS